MFSKNERIETKIENGYNPFFVLMRFWENNNKRLIKIQCWIEIINFDFFSLMAKNGI